MNINEIKESALAFKAGNKHELSLKIKELKDLDIPFSGCVAFLQYNQKISLSEARKQALDLNIWTQEERDSIHGSYLMMLSEFQEDEDQS
ncbi:hypothetical protein [Chryseobacterium pennipullorum]|uniref:Uncharacterized protein n=1 Tax=Chryseobacterium pennipullorum TaxID=2258963 RepID=A0A3D9B7Y7_9FLAO|nr:hypothetical protein [Chryseobacterium pennipullorum]REC49519.1 hypothetical protein DRF67_03320 [Chryseobacterium pennipullorum]